MWRACRHGLAISLFAALVPTMVAFAVTIPDAPRLDRPIVDETGTLSQDQITSLSNQIAASRQQKDYEIGVWMFNSLDGESITDLGIAAARKWGVGDEQKDNGVLITIAKQDRKVRIDVGTRLEPDLTDAEAGRIIRNTFAPHFRQNDFYGGISQGINDIAAQVTGKPERDSSQMNGGGYDPSYMTGSRFSETIFWIVIVGLNFIPWLMAIMARTKSWWLGGLVGAIIGVIIAVVFAWSFWSIIILIVMTIGGFILDWAVSRNYMQNTRQGRDPDWWAGGPWFGGGSSGGGGDFGGGSFGGGDFGGGGADGGW